ncbi:MAG: lipocalin family protein [Bacteroidetes bacterium]|nr:lipocalin family protein [Bacteroidota bacterium]MBM3455673.1 lipocalin family protein [Bacteroidota bacterium]
MKKLAIYVFVLTLTAAGISSCGKYEEGPGFSLLSKKARVTNTWKLTKVEVNGQDITPSESIYSLTMTLKDDETFSADYTFDNMLFNTIGTWAFSSDKSDLILSDKSGTSTNEIIRLTNKEMKLRQIDPDETIVNTYTAQ